MYNPDVPILILFFIELLAIVCYHIYMQRAEKLDTVNYHMIMTVGLIMLIMTSIFMIMVEIILKHSIVPLIVILLIFGILKKKFNI